jgi:hypothetical protein
MKKERMRQGKKTGDYDMNNIRKLCTLLLFKLLYSVMPNVLPHVLDMMVYHPSLRSAFCMLSFLLMNSPLPNYSKKGE